MRILVISSHTDDADLAIGGTIYKHTQDQDYVKHIVLSNAAISNGDIDTSKEWLEAQDVLGVQEKTVYDFRTRHFQEQSPEIMDLLFKINNEYQPDVVYTHSTYDKHQDHQVVSECSVRIFKYSDLFGYKLDWNLQESNLNGISQLRESDLVQKLEALKCYKSQSKKHYFSDNYIVSLAMTDGVKIKSIAEKFEVISKLFLVDNKKPYICRNNKN